MPVFFIYTGVTFDLQALLDSTTALLLLPVFLVLLLLVRGSAGLLSAPAGTVGADKRAIVLFWPPVCRSSWPSPASASSPAICRPARPRRWSAPACCRCCCSRCSPSASIARLPTVHAKPPDMDPAIVEEG